MAYGEWQDILEGTQKGTLDLTPWMEWSLMLSMPSMMRRLSSPACC